ncbi:heterodisulfide reductase-related iron-sulfur binding cluster [Bradyrhizobium sp. Pha-3]|uniref:heterodisulfide reductase-related iron-sulfur binding cluster n=1 Tax=Bradyrhizobium sp. Pha-3 TaxID=208375 RepID=UPI0035D46A50
MTTPALADFLDSEAVRLADACTRCGKCVEVCPVVPFGPMAAVPPQDVVGPVVAFLAQGQAMPEASRTWIAACNGCGACIPACPEAINPRRMLMLAATKQSEGGSRTPELFRRMSRAIKIMIAMQLVPAKFARLFVPARTRPADMVFYLGCNALRTPHLLFNTMAVLDALDADYEVVGGPSSCCGVISTKWEGALSTGERVTNNTISRFEGFSPERVLNWCPTCQLHLGETLEGYRKTSFSLDHVTAYLVSRFDDLKQRICRPVARCAVLHIHAGCIDIGRAVEQLLRLIPEFDLVETVVESGYTCGGSGCSKSPELATIEHGELLDRTRAAGADTLVTLYHGCHAIFSSAEKEGAFEVLNFTDLLVEAIGGVPHQDMLKRYRLIDDWDIIVNEAQPYLRSNGIEIDDEWLKRHGPEIFASAEFKGGLDCLGVSAAGGHRQ